MKTCIIGACSNLGLNIEGSRFGPKVLIKNIKSFYNGEILMIFPDGDPKKISDVNDKIKNKDEICKFNSKLYDIVKEKIREGSLPVTIGGDHSITIATALAACDIYKDDKLGLIWIDAHHDYNTSETTESGNIHGFPCAAVTGYKCSKLRGFHKGDTINPKNCAIVGAHCIDRLEKENINEAGVTVFSRDNIENYGIDAIMEKAFEIAGHGTNRVHISYDLDVIDPVFAPGVSVPENGGISTEVAIKIINTILVHKNIVSSIDLVEFNPLRDVNKKTERIILDMIKNLMSGLKNK